MGKHTEAECGKWEILTSLIALPEFSELLHLKPASITTPSPVAVPDNDNTGAFPSLPFIPPNISSDGNPPGPDLGFLGGAGVFFLPPGSLAKDASSLPIATRLDVLLGGSISSPFPCKAAPSLVGSLGVVLHDVSRPATSATTKIGSFRSFPVCKKTIPLGGGNPTNFVFGLDGPWFDSGPTVPYGLFFEGTNSGKRNDATVVCVCRSYTLTLPSTYPAAILVPCDE